ncbi:MAG: MarR family winged helix-turn-helix transcriptional regulator [Ardenticatenaceae bacterium]|nr:MarR family winged helix-turn-helix transcriptional regulator [Ardenticatenaceae bacterium]
MNLDDLSTFAARVQYLAYRLVKCYELCDRVCLTQHDVTVSQGYTILAFPQKGQISMNELSGSMEVASSTMTRMVDQLARKGLVYRKPGDQDRRVVRVGLTAHGQKVRHALEKVRRDFLREALADIPEDKRTPILEALEQLIRSIEKALESCCLD